MQAVIGLFMGTLLGGALDAIIQKAFAHAAQSDVTIVSLGDSVTRGVRQGVNVKETFAARIEGALKKRKSKAKVINVGIGGERTDQALHRLAKDVIALRPQVVTIMYGTNDSYVDKGRTEPRITVQEYEGNLRRMIAELRKAKIKPILMTPPAWGKAARNGAGDHPNPLLEKYVNACRKVARETETPLVDHFAHWSKKAERGFDIGQEWTTDQCHPNPRGHEAMANLIVPVIASVLSTQK
jgi:acyl-CoA thioesterase-1